MFPADQIKGTFDGLGGDCAHLVEPVSDAVNTVKDAEPGAVDGARHAGSAAVSAAEHASQRVTGVIYDIDPF